MLNGLIKWLHCFVFYLLHKVPHSETLKMVDKCGVPAVEGGIEQSAHCRGKQARQQAAEGLD